MEEEKTFTIGPYTLVMQKTRKGFHGHYTKGDSKEAFTFEGGKMTQKQILSVFWDRVKKEKNLKKGG